MTDEQERDMANTAIMLNEAVEKRVSAAILNILYGMSPKMGWSDNQDDPNDLLNNYDAVNAQSYVKIALMNLLKPALQHLIRQEIANAFSPSPDCTTVVDMGNTVHVETNLIVR